MYPRVLSHAELKHKMISRTDSIVFPMLTGGSVENLTCSLEWEHCIKSDSCVGILNPWLYICESLRENGGFTRPTEWVIANFE